MRDIIFDGYRPGVIGELVSLHGRYYSETWNFGPSFEAKVATELGAFFQDFRDNTDMFITAWTGDAMVGSITLEGPRENDGMSRLRWFIVSSAVRGQGVGMRLITTVVQHAREQRHKGIYLTTFEWLDAAAALYDKMGFVVSSELETDQWSGGVSEQRFTLSFD